MGAWDAKKAIIDGTSNLPMGAGVVVNTAASPIISTAGFAYSLFNSVASLVDFIVAGLFFPALALAFYIPFVPLLLWTVAIAGGFIHIVEAVVAAPVWAAAHASSEGDNLAGVHARAGYMLLLGILLRFPLMVFSFFAAFEMMDLMVFIFNALFEVENRSMAAGHVSGLVSMIAMLYLYTLTVIMLEHKIFGLITWIPDNVINWAGQTMGRSLGQEAKGEAQSVGGAAQNLPGGNAGNAAKMYKEAKDEADKPKSAIADSGSTTPRPR